MVVIKANPKNEVGSYLYNVDVDGITVHTQVNYLIALELASELNQKVVIEPDNLGDIEPDFLSELAAKRRMDMLYGKAT